MTIKSKISFFISILFSVLFTGICLFIFFNFSNFRKEEFEERLHEKALTSIKLLIEVKEVDQNLLKIIDQNTINKLYNEKMLIFDKDYNLIYSSLDNTKITWTNADLQYLKKNKTFFKRAGEYEVFGMFYDTNAEDYYALVTANDNFGNRKLVYLKNLLWAAGVIFIVAIWFFSFYIIKKQLLPLDIFHRKIKGINDLNTDTRLEIASGSKNEISLISSEFNYMMDRIKQVYQKQKEFTAHASHEFRTPLARISVQLENQIESSTPEQKKILKNILGNVDQLKELINSLLILSKAEDKPFEDQPKVRMDELIYESMGKVTAEFPDIKINFEMNPFHEMETLLEVPCNASLMEIALVNLIKNAYLYSDNKSVNVSIEEKDGKLNIHIINSGETITEEEQINLYQPFMRGQNSRNQDGIGLGLRMVDRIVTGYGYKLVYTSKENTNIFSLIF